MFWWVLSQLAWKCTATYVHTSKVGKFDFLKNCKAKWGEKKMPNVLLIRKMSNFLFQKSKINTFCKFVVDFILA